MKVMPRKKASYVETVEQVEWTPKVEVKERSHDLRSTLDKIKTKEGVIGYILRAATSATVDIKDPGKIIDYAVLSTSALETGENLLEAFGLGKLSSVVVKGKDLKMLLVTIDEQRISIFMDKDVDHNSIRKELPS
jgi:predicted regulator of Ras-like GTPase activity (Roadblock/LC7/MglB family)